MKWTTSNKITRLKRSIRTTRAAIARNKEGGCFGTVDVLRRILTRDVVKLALLTGEHHV